jgi:hypothetical protein
VDRVDVLPIGDLPVALESPDAAGTRIGVRTVLYIGGI